MYHVIDFSFRIWFNKLRVLIDYSVTELIRLSVDCYMSVTMHIFQQKF